VGHVREGARRRRAARAVARVHSLAGAQPRRLALADMSRKCLGSVSQALNLGASFWLTQWAADTLHQGSDPWLYVAVYAAASLAAAAVIWARAVAAAGVMTGDGSQRDVVAHRCAWSSLPSRACEPAAGRTRMSSRPSSRRPCLSSTRRRSAASSTVSRPTCRWRACLLKTPRPLLDLSWSLPAGGGRATADDDAGAFGLEEEWRVLPAARPSPARPP